MRFVKKVKIEGGRVLEIYERGPSDLVAIEVLLAAATVDDLEASLGPWAAESQQTDLSFTDKTWGDD